MSADFIEAYPDLSPPARAQLARFQAMLRGIPGLTGFGAEQIPEQIARSLLLAPLFADAQAVIDVGSGAGFPGIPLAVALPGRVWLLEPRRRTIAFLEKVIRELKLEASVIPTSAEEASRGQWRESFDGAVARALAPLPAAFELMAPLCRLGGKVVVTGSPGGLLDPLEIHPGLGLDNFRTETLKSGLDLTQTVHIMDKLNPTSEEFPRRPGRARRR